MTYREATADLLGKRWVLAISKSWTGEITSETLFLSTDFIKAA